MEKIEKTGKVNMGHREGAVPFGYMDEKGQWVGFDMDLGAELAKALEAKFGKKIEYVKTPMNPKNRIPKGFLGLQQGKIDAYFTDEAMPAGMRAKAQKPDDWEIVGPFLTYEPYGFILPRDDSKWRDFVNATLISMYKDGTFEKIYNKWFGPGGQLVLPMTEEYKTMLKVLSFPD
ncbi:MAG: transporter substrate-binding domain-containing protein [Syntrophobacteraceae bacterium]